MDKCIYQKPVCLTMVGIFLFLLAAPSIPGRHHPLLLSAFAQSATGTLSGTVLDEAGAVVPAATVSVVNEGTRFKRQTVTGSDGVFTLPLLPPGKYTVTAQRDGFTPVEFKNIILEVGNQLMLRIQMKVGRVGESITIVESGTTTREETAVGTVVNRQFVENLPLNGRSFQSLIELTPGVVLTRSTFQEQGQFSVNGQRASANYFTIDGVSANIGIAAGVNLSQSGGGAVPGFAVTGGTNNLVSVDALQEFRIQTSTFAPEFGRTPGAQISIITRSGTNDFRGTMFEYFRNDRLDANDYFTNSLGLKKPALRQNDFGGVFGGPVIKNRTFFFFSYEGLRLRQPQTTITSVPSSSARQDPAATSAIKQLLGAFPLPNGSDLGSGLARFSASYSNPSSLNATSLRLDHTVNDKLTIFGRYNYAPSDNVQRGGSAGQSLNNLTQTKFKSQTLTVSATWAITSKINNEFRANYSRTRGGSFSLLDDFGGASPPPDALLFPSGVSRQNALYDFVLSSTSLRFLVGKGADNLQRQINLIDNLSLTTGAHQLKFGIDYRRLAPRIDPNAYRQQAVFNGVPGALTAVATSVLIENNVSPRLPLFKNFSTYGQDTWKIKPRLTLTFGLRWEINPPPSEANGNDPFNLIQIDDPSTFALAPRGTPLYQTTYRNFAPRIGAAYQLSQRHGRETVLRGGFGIFYDLGASQAAGAFGFFPYTISKTLRNIPFPLNSTQAEPPPLTLIPSASTIFAFDPHLKLPYTYQWNFAVEQSLGASQTISASYVGAIGRRLLREEALFNPSPSFQFVFATRNAATSDYHAMQLQFQRRLARGLQALASYTWSHSIDTASDDSSNQAPASKIDPGAFRGPSNFDVRHSFTAAITYNIPAVTANAVGDAILRNWSVDTVFRARSATPVNVITGADVFGSLVTRVSRPDLIPGVPLYLDDPAAAGGRRINRTAFSVPTGRQGTLGRNALRGFPVSQIDFSIRRQFNLTERINLQFRAEFFNLFNHPNFADPDNQLNSGSLPNPFFGQSRSMLGRSLGSGGINGGFNPLYQIGGPRSTQFALKLSF